MFQLVFDDYPSAYTPALWANESLAILAENMVVGNLVHRDFEPVISSFGEVVNARRPGEFTAKRKSASDDVTIQATTATNIPVKLNQHWHTSFVIKDADQSKSFKDLTTEFLHPAMVSIARAIDQCVLGQVYQFLPNSAGQLGLLTKTNAEDYILDAREVLNLNKAHEMGRNMILTAKSETKVLGNQNFLQAYVVGDNGTALKEAVLGTKLGFAFFMAQNASYVAPGNTTVTGTVNNAAGYAAGSVTFTVDGLSAAISNGSWITIAGDDTPLRVVSTVGGATPTSITVSTGLKRAVADNAVVTIYTPGAVNFGAGYAVDYDKEIVVNGFTVAPRVGQMVTFGTSTTSPIYSIVAVNGTTGITLDRPLEAALADTNKVNIGPAGSYNFAFHRNAIALVTRPLALPMAGLARAGRADLDGFSVRVVMTYEGKSQGTLVTVDTLMGVKVLDQNLGAVMYG